MKYFQILKETLNQKIKSYKDKGGPRGIDHIGITVPDMDIAIKFLEEAFDAEIVYNLTPKGSPPRKGTKIENHLATPKGAEITRQTLMRLGTGPSLELFEFKNTEQKQSHMLQDFGLQHFTVFVDDMNKSLAAVKKAGGEAYYPPHRPDKEEGASGNLGCYIRPPWGGIIELFHYKEIRYPANSTIERWTPPEKYN